MTELEKDIQTALNADVELSKEDYAKKCAMADESTACHGVEGDAPVDEETRHARIRTNFYATTLNLLVNIYQLSAEIADSLKELRDGRNGKNE